jgi:hypothetical protein
MAYSGQYGTATVEEIIEYLQNILENEFSGAVTSVYFGDIGVYPPIVFGASRADQKAILVIQPTFDRPIVSERSPASEVRTIGLQVIAMVNITPFFTALPSEAYGERMLARLITAVAKFLASEANETLDGRVNFARVQDINWQWSIRKDQSLRGSAINYEVDVTVSRQ